MNIYKDFIKSTKAHESLLIVILIIYIIFDIPTPHNLLSLVNNGIFQAILIVLVFSLFFYVNPIISILAIIAVFILIDRSKRYMNSLVINEKNKFNNMLNYNQIPNSSNLTNNALNQYNANQESVELEVDMVNKMAPPVIESNEQFSFQPVTNKQHNAHNVHESYELS
tara:strand:- start:588 stop:1091 length:504 start_codon:yes stop_codon:yes gene_type:complete